MNSNKRPIPFLMKTLCREIEAHPLFATLPEKTREDYAALAHKFLIEEAGQSRWLRRLWKQLYWPQ